MAFRTSKWWDGCKIYATILEHLRFYKIISTDKGRPMKALPNKTLGQNPQLKSVVKVSKSRKQFLEPSILPKKTNDSILRALRIFFSYARGLIMVFIMKDEYLF